MMRLGDLFDFKNGRAFEKAEWKESGLPIIRIQNLNNPNSPFNYFQGSYDSAIEINSGDLLFSWSGTVGSSFGPHIWDRDTGLLNQHIFKISFKTDMVLKYAYYSLLYITEEIERSVVGAVGLVHVTKKSLNEFKIPAPPIPEQIRIVEILDQALSDINEVRVGTLQNLKNVRELFDSYLQQVFSQRGEGWVEKSISELGLVQTGNTPSTSDKNNFGDFIPFVKPGHFLDGGSLNLDIDGLSEQGKKQSRVIPENSVLMVCIGATIGKCGFSELEVTCNQQVNALTPVEELNHRFAYYQMLTPGFQSKVIRLSGQATLPIINKKKWSSLPLAYPCVTEQLEIVSRLDGLKERTLDLEAVYQNKMGELEALKKSILQKAFTGKLTYRESKGVAA